MTADTSAGPAVSSRIRIVPAGPATWPLVEQAMTGGGDGATCWCQWPLMTGREFHAASRAELRDRLRAEVEGASAAAAAAGSGDDPDSTQAPDPAPAQTSAPAGTGRPPGLVALVDGEAAGWCRVGPRAAQPRIERSRIARSGGASAEAGVWALSCLIVRREYRRLGVARELARAAVEFAGSHGANRLEAYPVDTEERPQTPANDLFHGSVSMLAAAGFREAAHPTPARAVMVVDLGSAETSRTAR